MRRRHRLPLLLALNVALWSWTLVSAFAPSAAEALTVRGSSVSAGLVARVVGDQRSGRQDADVVRTTSGPSDASRARDDDRRWFAMALDAVTWVTGSDAAPDSLSVEQLRDVFTCRVTNWAQLPGGHEGPIQRFLPPRGSGTEVALARMLGVDPRDTPSRDADPATYGGLDRDCPRVHTVREHTVPRRAGSAQAVFPYSAGTWVRQASVGRDGRALRSFRLGAITTDGVAQSPVTRTDDRLALDPAVVLVAAPGTAFATPVFPGTYVIYNVLSPRSRHYRSALERVGFDPNDPSGQAASPLCRGELRGAIERAGFLPLPVVAGASHTCWLETPVIDGNGAAPAPSVTTTTTVAPSSTSSTTTPPSTTTTTKAPPPTTSTTTAPSTTTTTKAPPPTTSTTTAPSTTTPATATTRPPAPPTTTAGYRVSGNQILRDGAPFVPIGANVGTRGQFEWWGDALGQSASAQSWEWNAVRLTLYTDDLFATPGTATTRAQQIIDEYTAKGIVVILGSWSCFSSPATPSNCAAVNAWMHDMAVANRDNTAVWYNCVNEPSADKAAWVALQDACVGAVRSAGSTSIVVADAPGAAADASWSGSVRMYDASMGPQVLAHDPQHNVVFSQHNYAGYCDAASEGAYLDKMHNAALAVMIGEFGFTDDGSTTAGSYQANHDCALANFAAATSHGVGLLAWHATMGDHYALRSGGQPFYGTSALTDFGSRLWDLTH